MQVNGKLRGRVFASPEASNDELEKLAFADEKVREHTDGKEVVKVVVVPKRLGEYRCEGIDLVDAAYDGSPLR